LCVHAETYVNQDQVEENPEEKTMAQIDEMSSALPNGLSTCEAILQEYFLDRADPIKIAQHYNLSKQYVYRIIKLHKAIMVKNIKKSVYSRLYIDEAHSTSLPKA